MDVRTTPHRQHTAGRGIGFPQSQPVPEVADRRRTPAVSSPRTARDELRLLRRALAWVPPPPLSEERLEGMLRTAVQAPVRRAGGWRLHAPGGRGGLATAAVLLLCIGFIFGRRFVAPRAPIPQIVLVARPVVVGPAVTDIALLFRASDPMPKANISLTLPEDVEIAGRPNVRALTWRADLESGANLLQLPLEATGARGGNLVIRLSEGPLVRTLEVPVTTRGARDSSAIRTLRGALGALG